MSTIDELNAIELLENIEIPMSDADALRIAMAFSGGNFGELNLLIPAILTASSDAEDLTRQALRTLIWFKSTLRMTIEIISLMNAKDPTLLGDEVWKIQVGNPEMIQQGIVNVLSKIEAKMPATGGA